MASIRLLEFGGLMTELSPELRPKENAQIAHNCLLLDGSLRPQAEWVLIREYYGDEVGIAYNPQSGQVVAYPAYDPVTLPGEPFAPEVTVGAGLGRTIERFLTGQPSTGAPVGVSPGGISSSISYQRSYDSDKPVNRVYAVSRVRKRNNRAEEGPLTLLADQSPTDILYEGDLVTINLSITANDEKATHVRIYRSISGLDTGQAIANDLDTQWHLVAELPIPSMSSNITYVDGSSATASPLDVAYSLDFHPPEIEADFFGLTESGWFIAASKTGKIAVSERFMHHAWPVENEASLPVEITDTAVQGDNFYIGTKERPYIVSIAIGDKPMQLGAVPFGEYIPCLPNTMTPTPSGVIYASGQGLVALSREGQIVLTRDVINAGDLLYKKLVVDSSNDPKYTEARIGLTGHGRYFAGRYYGFCDYQEFGIG